MIEKYPVKTFPSRLEVLKEVPDACYECRHDWNSYEEVQRLSLYLTARTGKSYVGVDRGQFVSPRFDVIECPIIGDKISMSFNCDAYPDGEIISISKKLTVTTSTGKVYRRKGNTAKWLQTGGTWCMVRGHVSETNPSF